MCKYYIQYTYKPIYLCVYIVYMYVCVYIESIHSINVNMLYIYTHPYIDIWVCVYIQCMYTVCMYVYSVYLYIGVYICCIPPCIYVSTYHMYI